MSETEAAEVANSRPWLIRNLLLAIAILSVSIAAAVWSVNYFSVDRPLQRVLAGDERNRVVKAQAHFGGWVDPDQLVFNIRSVSEDATRIDVFRSFLQYAEAMKDRKFSKVILSDRGRSKFTLDGLYFQDLGVEYSTQNPMYTIRTFPSHLRAMDGSKPFSEIEGGIFGVLELEMQQFTDFSNQWYLDDFQASLSPSTKPTSANPTESFDPCDGVREQDPHCGWKPHWEDSGVSVNAIDSVKTEFLSTESTDPDGEDYGKLHYAELKLCFENGKLCGGNHIGVGVGVHGMVASSDYESEYSTPVRLKFDDDPPVRQTWGISDDHEMLFPNGREKQFLAELTQHKKLVLEFSYYEKAARTVTFDLSGLLEKANADNLEIDSEPPVNTKRPIHRAPETRQATPETQAVDPSTLPLCKDVMKPGSTSYPTCRDQ